MKKEEKKEEKHRPAFLPVIEPRFMRGHRVKKDKLQSKSFCKRLMYKQQMEFSGFISKNLRGLVKRGFVQISKKTGVNPWDTRCTIHPTFKLWKALNP